MTFSISASAQSYTSSLTSAVPTDYIKKIITDSGCNAISVQIKKGKYQIWNLNYSHFLESPSGTLMFHASYIKELCPGMVVRI